MSGNKKVLLIDDDDLVRLTLHAYLEDSGYEVRDAAGGREGLDCFAREAPDIVLTDLRMPDLDGFQVLAAIKKISPATPVIIVSGAGDAGISHGEASAFLLKPVINMKEMVSLIERVLDEARRGEGRVTDE